MTTIRLIALDLDGTLLDSDKRLPPANYDALERAHRAGALIVPATGRYFAAMPEQIRSLPFLEYAITINGARVSNADDSDVLYRADLSAAQSLELMRWLDTLPVIYDCYMDNTGWMTEDMQRRASEFAPDRHFLKMMRELRTPVPELKAFVAARGHDVQKVQFFTNDLSLRADVLRTCAERFPGTVASASCPNNVEINHSAATKGAALLGLCRALSISPAETLAFGDGLNDISMLQAAGVGVAMGNAPDPVKAAADLVTAGCDEAGVAAVVDRFFPAARQDAPCSFEADE
jgi:Cof subfamily protein (haloacid dehalogenase superfamily)